MRTYIVDYRPGEGGRLTKKKRVTIGRHGSPWTPDTARDEAKHIVADVAGGADPAAERKSKRQAPDAARTFAAVVQRYVSLHGRRLRPSTLADNQHVFSRYLEPEWGQRYVATIERRDVTELGDGIAQRAPVRARSVFGVARSFFGWCVEKGYRAYNPCESLEGPRPCSRR